MDAVQAHRSGQFSKVVIGFCCAGHVEAEFCMSMTDALIYDAMQQQLITGPGGGVVGLQSSPRIAETRSQIVEAFLQSPVYQDEDGFRPDWLLMVDSDMVFKGEDIYTLLASADPVDKPIVGGLCFAGGHSGVLFPTLYQLHKGEDGLSTSPIMEYEHGAMYKVGATGCAFLLIHRQALIKIGKAFSTMPNGARNPYPWFTEGNIDAYGRAFGEDIAFCIRAGACGIPVYVNTNVRIGHVKRQILTERLYDDRNSRAGNRES